jgi:hypothetical protein
MDHSLERIGKADIMVHSRHLLLEGVERIPEILPQNDCYGFGVVDDESTLFRMESKVDRDRSDPSLETSEKSLDEFRAVM